MKTAIWWIRRDLRLADNPALEGALAAAEKVVPVFVLDPGLMSSRYNGEKRTAFLLGGLRALDRSLRERGSRLVLREGDPERELGKLKEESGADAIFIEQQRRPDGREEGIERKDAKKSISPHSAFAFFPQVFDFARPWE